MDYKKDTTVPTVSDVSIFARANRAKGKKNVYYCQLRNPATGKISEGKMISVSKLAKVIGYECSRINKNEARHIVSEALKRGILQYGTNKDSLQFNGQMNLITFVKEMCDYETSPWVAYESLRKSRKPSKRYIDNIKRAFELHAEPLLKQSFTVDGFSKRDAIELQSKMLKKGISPNCINDAFKAMKRAYNYAVMIDIVDSNPLAYVKQIVVKAKERDLLTRLEASAVLDVMKKHACEDSSRKSIYLTTKLAIHAGMREGEIRAFSINRMSQVFDDAGKTTDYYKIEVSEQWDESLKAFNETKGRYKRTTVIYKDLAAELIAFHDETGRSNEEILFRASKDRFNKRGQTNTPMTKNMLQNYLYRALEEIGIDREKQKQRGLTFHSLRHFYVSQMKAVARRMELYYSEIRSAVGHKSKAVDEMIYTHDTSTSLIMLGVLSRHILDIADEPM